MSKKQKKKPAKKNKKKTNQEPANKKSHLTTEVWGLVALSCSIILIISLLSFAYGHESRNWFGLTGHTIGWVFHAFFGLSAYLVALFIGWIGWRLLFDKPINHPILKTLNYALLVLSVSMLLSLIEDHYPTIRGYLGSTFYAPLWKRGMRYHLGGAPFYFIYQDLPTYNFSRIFNSIGVMLIFTSTLIASLLYLTKISTATILEFITRSLSAVANLFKKSATSAVQGADAASSLLRFVKLKVPNIGSTNSIDHEMLEISPEKELSERPSLSRKKSEPEMNFSTGIKDFGELFTKRKQPFREPQKESPQKTPSKREAALTSQRIHNGDFKQYKLPSQNLLTSPKKVDQTTLKQDLRKQAEVLEETLLSFGIEAKVGQINCGPTITSFEVHPAIGVKVQKIKSLESDIALNMEAKSIRILAPIPGKAAIGIEVPNPTPQEVSFKDMLGAYQKTGRTFHIPILLGKTVNGEYVMSDLAKMPHCIIAGATGSGKSVCINTIVMSIVMNAKPDEIKLIMVDPKKVELTPYTRLPHMLAPVITEPAGACTALYWLVKEMEKRYEILKQIGVRNIDSFNKRKIDKEFEESLNKEIPESMHYIVCIIDELADLMMVASNDIETHIARIAQMARAVGIHLILATQRPSREVITGLIKANFPTRISFKVASRVNSQIILDDNGAESLLGNGDMLFLPPGSTHNLRAQGAFIRDEDINAVIDKICEQAPTNYVIESFDNMQDMETLLQNGKPQGNDSMFEQALEIVTSTGNASTTFLQRKLKIGYARAASIMDELEEAGIISSPDGSKARKVLVTQDSDE